jgi:hypothetical protein
MHTPQYAVAAMHGFNHGLPPLLSSAIDLPSLLCCTEGMRRGKVGAADMIAMAEMSGERAQHQVSSSLYYPKQLSKSQLSERYIVMRSWTRASLL